MLFLFFIIGRKKNNKIFIFKKFINIIIINLLKIIYIFE